MIHISQEYTKVIDDVINKQLAKDMEADFKQANLEGESIPELDSETILFMRSSTIERLEELN